MNNKLLPKQPTLSEMKQRNYFVVCPEGYMNSAYLEAGMCILSLHFKTKKYNFAEFPNPKHNGAKNLDPKIKI